MASPDLSLLADQFQEFGGPIFGKRVTEWNLSASGIQVRTNVNAPQALVKVSSLGKPRPYSTGDNADGNGPKFTERILTAYQSKMDFDFDPEKFRNTVLANASGSPFYEQSLNQMAKEYLDSINLSVLGLGVRNANGTDPEDICDGWLTIIAKMIADTDAFEDTLTPITVGTPTADNAVAKFDIMKKAVPTWMKQQGFIIYCSYSQFENYAANYRTVNGFKFEPRITGDYPLDNSLSVIRPQAWMGSSNRLIATVTNNLVFGTDIERISIAATPYRNILKGRQMFPAGCDIQDPEAIFVSDVA